MRKFYCETCGCVEHLHYWPDCCSLCGSGLTLLVDPAKTPSARTVELPLPPEFVAQCADDGVDPVNVLQGFIKDLCHLPGSNGSDERRLADEYYERCGYRYQFEDV